MRLVQFLATFGTIAALGCVNLCAQGTPQTQITFTPGSSGTWNADWNGVAGRTYFVQFSIDLVNWNYAPILRHGNGVQSLGIQTENAGKLFIRLNYVDDPSVTSLAEAEAADFDGDGLTNLEEILLAGTNPFNGDSDGDEMPDLWEFQNGLNPTVNDANGDLDNDGMTNLEEYQNGTKVNFYDSDSDGFPDGFEFHTAGYDPLVFNDASGDADMDGLKDIDELTYGTDPSSADSDQDGFTDSYEIANGSNPLDSLSTPFIPYSHFGASITNAYMQPMGDLGTANYGHGDSYKVTFRVSDSLIEFGGQYLTNQEAWRMIIGDNMSLTPPPYKRYLPTGGYYAPYSMTNQLQLDNRKTYQVYLQYLGLAGLSQSGTGQVPDYQHSWWMSGADFLMLTNDANVPISTSLFASQGQFGSTPNYNFSTRINYLVPVAKLGYATSYTGNDSTGPRYRKISHTGRPIPDAKPESESESDEAAEESYVDAFDLSLHHDTSFASIPLAASDLRLEANASVRETTWSNRSGLRPEEEITAPFGIGWSSNLCSHIETVETLGSSTTRPTSVNVIDEGGRGQRFGTLDDMTTFFPWPSARTDKKTYLNELTKVGENLVLKKKYGNTLTYSPCDAWFMYDADRLESTPSVVRHNYWRLIKVEDRFGAQVVYDYGTNPYSLIPVEIRAVGRADQKLTIARSLNGRRVLSVTDAEDNTTHFHYTNRTISIPSTTFSYPYQELSKVTFPHGVEEHYTYEVVSDPETVGTKLTYHLHANLKSIMRDGHAMKVFTYAYDRTKQWYDHSLGRVAITASLAMLPESVATRAEDYVANLNNAPQSGSTLRDQHGIPRMISMIEWPAMNIQSSFSKATGTQTTFGPTFSSTNRTEVTDAEGRKYTYTFGGTHGEIIDTASSAGGGTSSVSNQWIIYHTSATIQYKSAEGTVLGSETYEFDTDSGLSLKRTVDFCGNETVWDFDYVRPTGPRITLADKPDFLAYWADPTRKTDALGRIEDYEYGNHRMLTKLTDPHGSVIQYTVDDKGRRTEMTVTSPGGTLLQREIYEYDNEDFPGFMIKKTRKAYSNLSGKAWEQDLVVDYVADTHGRLWKEIVYSAAGNLVTIHTYDLNNRKTSTTDPRGLTTNFEYDESGRLIKTVFADYSFKTYGYDENNAKIRETDENGHSTLIERDGLGRVTATVRDMDGNGSISAGDIVSEISYNDVGLPLREIDARGFATVNFYDDLHRLQHVFKGVPEASSGGDLTSLTSMASSSRKVTHQQFVYNTADNAGGGLLQPSKPTGIINHNAVSMSRGDDDETLTDYFEYDAVYRPIETRAYYAPSLAKTTQYNYGVVNENGREPLVTTITDDLNKVTRITRDAMGRERETIDGYGNSDPSQVLTTTRHYTSTGLPWRVVDPLLRDSESEYDQAGRVVKSYQPDPATGKITSESPVTGTEYDENSNVVAMIDPLNRRTEYDYDSRNRKWRTRQPAVTNAADPDTPVSNVHPTTTSTFDFVGNEISVTDARGSTACKFYDKANRLVSVRTNPHDGDPSSIINSPGTYDITTHTAYDKGGLVLSIEDGNGNITRNAYDSLARLIATACDPSDGNPAEFPVGELSVSAYRSSHSTSALVSYLHDDAGNIIEVTDGEGSKTAFTFDGFQRSTSIIWDPGASAERTETYEYNALVKTSREDGKGHVTNYAYDSLYRLTNINYSNHTENRLLTYDKAGRVLSVTYPNDSGSIRNVASTYDYLDRLTSETSAGVTHTYQQYDKAGNRKRTTYGRTGTTLVCTYDDLNRLETCEERSEATTPSGRTTTYAYDLGGNVTRKTLPNGNATTTNRDKLGRTIHMSERTASLALVSSFNYSQSVGPWRYSHDAVGNVLRCSENHTMSGITDRVVFNTYDHCNRLHTETITPSGGSAVTTDYSYDLADNRISKAIGSSVTEYKFGNGNNGANSNQLREYGSAGGPATHTFTYDNNGNRQARVTGAGTETYTWDNENRLIALDTPSGDYLYAYDHRSRRVLRDESEASGVITKLTFSGGTSVQEASNAGNVRVEIIRGSDWGGGIGGVLFTIRSGERSYNAYNSRGDVVSVTNESGTATWQASYEAFGTRTEEDGANTERHRANTKEEDPTGLLNEGFRYRDLEAGVFISRDPLGFVDGPNVYTYVRQNPWTFFDPLGLFESNPDYEKWRDVASDGKQSFGNRLWAIPKALNAGLNPFRSESNLRRGGREFAENAETARQDIRGAPAGIRQLAQATMGVAMAGTAPLSVTSGVGELGDSYNQVGGVQTTKNVVSELVSHIKENPVEGLTELGVGILTGKAFLGSTSARATQAQTMSRVFWSGSPDAKAGAEAFARGSGGTTLEMTLTGKVLDAVTTKRTYPHLKPLWDRASTNFAKGASGPVDVFQSSRGVRLESVWATKEYPVLFEKGNPINYHSTN